MTEELKTKYCCSCVNSDCNFDCIAKQEDNKVQQRKTRSYSRFEECIILLLAKFFSKEKDINKFSEWLEKYLKNGDDKTMKDVEIVVFNDKSWVRLKDFEQAKDHLEEENKQLAKRICELQSDLSRVKGQIKKMKCCHSCLSHKLNNLKNCQTCDGNYSNWELAE